MRLHATTALLTALAALGCAGEESRSERTEAAACRKGAAAPITEREIRDAFTAEGIQLYRRSDCFGDELVLLSNIAEGISSEEEDDALADSGAVYCEVYGDQVSGARLQRFVWRNDPDPIHLRTLNLNCSYYPENRRQTDVVEQAIRRLRGVDPRPSVVPSDDAMRD
jgi:hypothetical protein